MKKKNGFTLVELTISIGLLAIVILFVVNYISIIRKNEDGISLDTKLYLNKQMISEVINEDIIKTGKVSEVSEERGDIVIYFTNGQKRIITTYQDGKILVYKEEDRVLYSKESVNNFVFEKEVEDKETLYVIHIKTNEKSTYDINITIYKDPSVAVRYVYWSANEGGIGTRYQANATPSTTYNKLSEAGWSNDKPIVKTKIDAQGNIAGHKICLYYNSKLFCLDNNYWVNNATSTETKLKDDLEETTGVPTTECTTTSTSVHCYYGYTNVGVLANSGPQIYASLVAVVLGRDGSVYFND